MSATGSFNLIVKNPCIDAAFLRIEKQPFLDFEAYTLFERETKYRHEPFKIVSSDETGALCGGLRYTGSVDGSVVGVDT